MFDRIEMNIIDMPGEIVFVANGVLPKPLLPKREIAVRIALQLNSGVDQRVAETPFDPPPAARKIRIIQRQCEDGMQVIRKNYNRVDCKRAFTTGCAKSLT
jgi:hypothetical protein